MKVGERIKEQRTRYGWSQEQLAKELHVSRSAVSSWEVGRNYPDLETILAISDLFGISLDNLLREDVEMVKETTKKTKRLSMYRSALLMITMVCLILVGYRGKQLFDEYLLRNRFVENGWNEVLVDGEQSNFYEMTEDDVTFKAYINENDDQTFTLFVINHENYLFEVTQDNEIMASLSSENDRIFSENYQLKLDNQGKPLSLPYGLNEKEEEQILSYFEENSESYQQMIDKALELKTELES